MNLVWLFTFLYCFHVSLFRLMQVEERAVPIMHVLRFNFFGPREVDVLGLTGSALWDGTFDS
jgi:hypothetical protein